MTMKIRASAMLWLSVLGWHAQPALGQDTEPPFKEKTVPGQLVVKSIEDMDVAPALKESARAQIRKMKEHKVMPVSDHEVPDFEAAEARYRGRKDQLPQLIADKKLMFSPANIDASSLHGQTLVGAIPSGVHVGSSWTGLSRMFHHPGLRYVILDEIDLGKNGGGAVFTKELINAEVNGAPAVLVSMQGSEKKSETKLTWFADGVLYSLHTPGVNDKARDELLEIAQRISK